MLSRFNTEIYAYACTVPRMYSHIFLIFAVYSHVLFMATLFSFARDFNINLILTFQYRFIIILLNIILLLLLYIINRERNFSVKVIITKSSLI